MPAKDGLRLNDPGCIEQARPEPSHPDQQGPVAAAQSKTRRRTPQSDAELMAKEQVLGYKPAPRLEQVDDEHSERVEDCEHRPQSCDDSPSRRESLSRMEFSERTRIGAKSGGDDGRGWPAGRRTRLIDFYDIKIAAASGSVSLRRLGLAAPTFEGN